MGNVAIWAEVHERLMHGKSLQEYLKWAEWFETTKNQASLFDNWEHPSKLKIRCRLGSGGRDDYFLHQVVFELEPGWFHRCPSFYVYVKRNPDPEGLFNKIVVRTTVSELELMGKSTWLTMPVHGASIHAIDWFVMSTQKSFGTVQCAPTVKMKELRVLTRIYYKIPSNISLKIIDADGYPAPSVRRQVRHYFPTAPIPDASKRTLAICDGCTGSNKLRRTNRTCEPLLWQKAEAE